MQKSSNQLHCGDSTGVQVAADASRTTGSRNGASASSVAAPPAIRVEGLGKVFRIGSREKSAGTLREAVANLPDLFRRSRQRQPSQDRFWALKDVSFEVRQGEVVGVVGANGAGKSTLLKILSRIIEPTIGRARLRGRVCSLLEIGTGFHPELTGLENIHLSGAILGMTRREIRRKVDEIVAFAEIEEFLNTPVKRYSTGMYLRLAFAVAAHLESDILIVDEVLAVGDAAFQMKCLKKMNREGSEGRTVLFVSHNMSAVRRLCSRAVLLERGRIVASGNASRVTETYLKKLTARNPSRRALPRGFLFVRDASQSTEFCITAIQILGADGEPLEVLGTWDYVRFRIHFSAPSETSRGAVLLKVQTSENVPLLLCSSQPDSTVPLRISAGDQVLDCVFPRWPLAAGTYVLGAGLAIPTVEFLCWEEHLCELNTVGRDVYGSGLAPSSDRYLVAAQHHWEHADATGTSIEYQTPGSLISALHS